MKVEEVSVMALAEGLRQQATAECKERGSVSEFKPTTSTVLSTGRLRTWMLLLLLLLVLVFRDVDKGDTIKTREQRLASEEHTLIS